MKIRSKGREGNRVTIEAEAEHSRFEAALGKALEEVGREVKLPGFRPGKAPREMLERTLSREAVENRAAQNLIAEIYPEIIAEAKIDPIDFPSVEILKQEKGHPFAFKLSVEVYPEVKLGKYKGLKVQKKSTEVAEEEVMKILGDLQERLAAVGADSKRQPPPLDDEFAKKVSHFGTLAELKAQVRGTLEKEKAAEAEADLKDQLVAAVSADAKMEIPAAMVEREIDVMLDELRTSLSRGNLTLEDYLRGAKKEEKTLRQEMRKSAEIRVKGKLVLKAVAEEEKISVAPEEVQAEAKTLGIEKNLGEGSKAYIEDYLLRKKALEFLIKEAKI